MSGRRSSRSETKSTAYTAFSAPLDVRCLRATSFVQNGINGAETQVWGRRSRDSRDGEFRIVPALPTTERPYPHDEPARPSLSLLRSDLPVFASAVFDWRSPRGIAWAFTRRSAVRGRQRRRRSGHSLHLSRRLRGHHRRRERSDGGLRVRCGGGGGGASPTGAATNGGAGGTFNIFGTGGTGGSGGTAGVVGANLRAPPKSAIRAA